MLVGRNWLVDDVMLIKTVAVDDVVQVDTAPIEDVVLVDCAAVDFVVLVETSTPHQLLLEFWIEYHYFLRTMISRGETNILFVFFFF